MEQDKIIVILKIHKRGESHDVEIPTDISANDLIVALNSAFKLGMNTVDSTQNCLKTENPITLLRGTRLISEYGLHNGTVINFTD